MYNFMAAANKLWHTIYDLCVCERVCAADVVDVDVCACLFGAFVVLFVMRIACAFFFFGPKRHTISN